MNEHKEIRDLLERYADELEDTKRARFPFELECIDWLRQLLDTLESHGPEGRNYTNLQYVTLLQDFETLKGNYRQLLDENQSLTKQMKNFMESWREQKEEIRSLRAGYTSANAKHDEELYFWEPYAENHLETLTGGVVIRAEWIRQLIAEENKRLLYENQRLTADKEAAEIAIKAWKDENQAIKELLKNEQQDLTDLHALYVEECQNTQAQSKEIEQLKIDKLTIFKELPNELFQKSGEYDLIMAGAHEDWAHISNEDLRDLRFELQALREREVRYREALEWYGDTNIWQGEQSFDDYFESAAELDEGDRARKALIGNQEEGI